MSEHEQYTNKPVWKSHVFHGDKCFFVSTIERTYDTYAGSTRGLETIVWDYDWDKRERGNLIHQGSGIYDHIAICRCLMAEGICPNEDNKKYYI